jgi:hypothetical protein
MILSLAALRRRRKLGQFFYRVSEANLSVDKT